MDKANELLLKKLLAKSARECGLDDIDHRKLTRLIDQADREQSLLIIGASRDKAIFTSESGVPSAAPDSAIRRLPVKLRGF